MSSKKFNITPEEKRVIEKLDTPMKIQDFLDTLAINFEEKGETFMSPRRVLRTKKCHCIEAAFFATFCLWFHGEKPVVIDMKGAWGDWDHVIAIFKKGGGWGAISKTNHVVLRYREPVYNSIRELVMSYFHEYTDDRKIGIKTLRSYSKPINLKNFGKDWIVSEKNLWDLHDALNKEKHFQIMTKEQIQNLRKADKIEVAMGELTEWGNRGKKHKWQIKNIRT